MKAEPTLEMVDCLLTQVRLDASAPYWAEGPHADTRAAAESWLLSLRDHLDAAPYQPTPVAGGEPVRSRHDRLWVAAIAAVVIVLATVVGVLVESGATP